MPPEYVIDGLFSIKSDVFSFGVLVLEILSGKRNRRFYHPDHMLNLLGHVSDVKKYNYCFFIFLILRLSEFGPIVPSFRLQYMLFCP